MTDLALQLLPIFVYFSIGMVLKRQGIADTAHGEFLLRLVFMVTLPMLILLSVSRMPLSLAKAMLPLANIGVNLACMAVTWLLTRRMDLSRATSGTLLVNTMIVNNSFMFPFILAVYGDEGFADAILFDFGNALMMATFTYAVAFRHSSESHGTWAMLGKILKSPLVWSLCLALLCALAGVGLPARLVSILDPVAQMTAPLILIALGIVFSLKISDVRLVGLAVTIRMGLGLLFGMGLASLMGLEGTTFIVVSLCSAAPIGFMALTITSLAKLDMPLSASAVSVSLLAGMIYIPILLILFGMP